MCERLIVLFLSIICIQTVKGDVEISPSVNMTPDYLSMNAVLSNRDLYDGKKVLLVGVLSVGFEADYLFLNKDAYEYYMVKDSICLLLDEDVSQSLKKYMGKYVVLEGVFAAVESHEKAASAPGRLMNVKHVRLAAKRTEFESGSVGKIDGVSLD